MILLHLSKYTVLNMLKSLCMHDKLLMINAVHFNRIVTYRSGFFCVEVITFHSSAQETKKYALYNNYCTVKHAIWLVNSRAGSGYPARGIKMDFRGILKMSLFHCSYFKKQLPNGFPSRIARSMHLGCYSTFGKRKNTLARGSSIFTLSESLATSLEGRAWYSFRPSLHGGGVTRLSELKSA